MLISKLLPVRGLEERSVQLVPNILLTRKPIVIVQPPPSLFDFVLRNKSLQVGSYLVAHGYEVFQLRLFSRMHSGLSLRAQLEAALSAHCNQCDFSRFHWAYVRSYRSYKLIENLREELNLTWVPLDRNPCISLKHLVSLAESEWR